MLGRVPPSGVNRLSRNDLDSFSLSRSDFDCPLLVIGWVIGLSFRFERFLSEAKPSAVDGSLVVTKKQRAARKHVTEPNFRLRRAVPVGTGRRALD